MTRTLDPGAAAGAPPSPEPTIRAVYRDGDGAIHLDWPADRIGDAVEDHAGALWVDIDDREAAGNGRVEALLRDVFKFHPLAIVDALKDTNVPRVDDWGDYLYLAFHSIDPEPVDGLMRFSELDIFLGRNYLVTYHNAPIPEVDQLRRNIERDPANRCRHGAANILYHLLDLIVASYLPAIQRLDDAIDDAQDEVFARPGPRTIRTIFQIKRLALQMSRVIAPEREAMNRLARDEYAPIPRDQRIYFRDAYDHLVRVHDINESLRDLIAGALDTYLSAVSNRTNEIMKAFTLVTVMFLPMTFLTGFFGMNFFGDALSFHVSLPRGLLFALTCLAVVITPAMMWLWARRKGWF
jgi:magnesium transporter